MRDGFIPGKSILGAVFTGVGFVDGVVAYSFSDGHQVLTKENSTATIALGFLSSMGSTQSMQTGLKGFSPENCKFKYSDRHQNHRFLYGASRAGLSEPF